MDEDPKQVRAAEPRRMRQRYLVAGLPVWTYLLTALTMGTWSVHGAIKRYGVNTAYGWWGGFGDLMIFVMAAVLLVVGVPALLVEVWALSRTPQLRWLARAAVVVYVVLGCSSALLPVGLRFGGDASPLDLRDVTLGAACCAIVVVVHVIAVAITSYWWTTRQRARRKISG